MFRFFYLARGLWLGVQVAERIAAAEAQAGYREDLVLSRQPLRRADYRG